MNQTTLKDAIQKADAIPVLEWNIIISHPIRVAFSDLLDAARGVIVEHSVTKEIQTLLSGTEWDSDTCQAIAEVLRDNGYPVIDVSQPPELVPMAPPNVIAAFAHALRFFPEAWSVTYDPEGRWVYRDINGDALDFTGALVSVDILGFGADAAPTPSVFFLVGAQ
jgi:hypothetical protein